MDIKLELVALPVTDVDRAKKFYVDQVGFVADIDQTVSDEIRFVQLTPPGSACSIAFGLGITDAAPGSVRAIHHQPVLLFPRAKVAEFPFLIVETKKDRRVLRPSPSGWRRRARVVVHAGHVRHVLGARHRRKQQECADDSTE